MSCGLAFRADQFLLPLLLQAERPIEQGRGCGLDLEAPALWLHRLLGDELRPGEQRLLRLRCLVAVAVPVGVAAVAQDELDRRHDADGGVVAVAVDLDGLRLDPASSAGQVSNSFQPSSTRFSSEATSASLSLARISSTVSASSSSSPKSFEPASRARSSCLCREYPRPSPSPCRRRWKRRCGR